jgi:hypothetical protein
VETKAAASAARPTERSIMCLPPSNENAHSGLIVHG